MPDSFLEELNQVNILMREGKFQEALKITSDLEKKSTLFNTFSGEIFSKSIDRIKIGENIILINPIESFLACYVIRGQSYPAQQKLSQFTDAIKKSGEIWDTLNRAVKTSEVLELDNPASLGNLVKEIFT